MKNTTVYDSSLITMPRNHMEQGNLTSVENYINIPFNVKRVFILYDVNGGDHRNGHASKEQWQFVVATCGSFNVILDDSKQKRTIMLNRANQGLIIPPGIWRKLDNFSSGAICLVLASDNFNENDYVRNYAEFQKYKK